MKNLLITFTLFARFTLLITILTIVCSFSPKDSTKYNKIQNMENHVNDITKENIIRIKQNEPLLIRNLEVEDNKIWDKLKKFGAVIGIIGGFLGLIVTGYAINDRWFKDPRVVSKIISYASSDGEFEEMKINNYKSQKIMKYGVKFFIKLSINITNEDLNYKDLEVFVKFKKLDEVYKGIIYSPRNYADWKIAGKLVLLRPPQDQLLYYKSNLKKNTTYLEYLNFLVLDYNGTIKENLKSSDFNPESIQLKFVSSEVPILKKSNKIIYSNKMNLDSGVEKYIWEDEIWLTPSL